MSAAVYLPILAALALALGAPRLARNGSAPAVATWTLSVSTGAAALACLWSLALVTATLADDLLPTRGRAELLRGPATLTDLVGLLAGGTLVITAVRAVRGVVRRHHSLARIRRACPATGGPLVVLDDPVPQAFALPGRTGRIVLSTGMLAALDPAERRVVLAHERAHLSGHHHRHAGVARVAADLLPILAPVRDTILFLCERWADERAAAAVGDRRLAATALARAGLATNGAPAPPPPGLAYSGSGVGARVTALLRRPPRRGPSVIAMVVLVTAVLALGADIHATADFWHLVETLAARH